MPRRPLFRLITWNVRRATAESTAWEYLLGLKPDLALLQEVGGLPPKVLQHFAHRMAPAVTRAGRPQRFSTAILVRGELGPDVPFQAARDWVNTELQRVAGNLLANEVTLARATDSSVLALCAASIYGPAWPVDPNRLSEIDLTGVRLTLNKDVWIADLLWSALQDRQRDSGRPWVIAGDFNLSETFDLWADGPRGNREYLDRMSDLGFVECLRRFQGVLTPTYRNTDKRTIKHQMDHLFVSNVLSDALIACTVGDPSIIFDQNLSDHLPIIADFDTAERPV
jgi:Exonuclease III